MKANEFIKKYGITEAKRVLHCMDDASEFKTHMPGDAWDKPTLIDAVGLRRLVESHELIESCGGIHMARADVMDLDGFEKTSPHWMKIKQAIIDVESCQ